LSIEDGLLLTGVLTYAVYQRKTTNSEFVRIT